MKDFLKFFIAGFIGAVVYELIVYFLDPFNPDWLSLLIEIVILSLVVAAVVSLIKYFTPGNSDKQDKNA